ncbi:hypothetical protein FC80_GL001169 [Liquorilactobacillus cacaonum DSM 21116]|uniref:Uncharacterized protein n=2 Tax=Liquorilactobacillus cacaonum TaxID=483012 RepID=A0A0R2CPU9_9LACO|nr:hypothetical protein FC80_GL001169 [Liquorilactobacillus cacaonum DSM 21116]
MTLKAEKITGDNYIMENLSKRLIDKSIEAFIMGIEIYNKPTIHYRIEGFSFFVINAWELMLKAELLNRNESIYFKNDPSRTLSASGVVNKIYTDKNTRIRLNLEKIIDLRNISTHYITEDYEVKYAPLFQACVLNFISEINKFHKVDITKYIPQNFLTVSANYAPLSNEEIKLKYSPEIAEKFIKQANEIDVLSHEFDSDKFSINIKQNLYITKKKSDADFTVKVDMASDNQVSLVKELKDPSNTHKYSYNSVITAVNIRLNNKNIKLDYSKGFNQYILKLVIDFYSIKKNELYAYEHVIGNQQIYTYSQQFIDFIVSEIKQNPSKFVESLRSNKKR